MNLASLTFSSTLFVFPNPPNNFLAVGSFIGAKAAPKRLADVAATWEDEYKTNKLLAVVKLFNCVLLSAGVNPKNVLTEDKNQLQDLDALDAEEMTEMLEEATQKIEKGLIVMETKTGENFRFNFGTFFKKLVDRIMTSAVECEPADLKRIEETLKAIVEPFVMMTSFSHHYYRYAFAEATMSMAISLIAIGATLHQSIATQQRLLKAEESKAGGGTRTV